MLAQVSAVMNSRPLAALSDDSSDLEFLTPAHFFLLEPIVQPFGANVQDIPDNRLKSTARAQKISQLIWKAWSQDYLHEFQQRRKWATERANVKIGDLVLIRNENTPPTFWKTGRIIEVFPGADGRVRNVRLKTATGELERPVQKLCLLLPMEFEAETSRAQCVESDTITDDDDDIGSGVAVRRSRRNRRRASRYKHAHTRTDRRKKMATEQNEE